MIETVIAGGKVVHVDNQKISYEAQKGKDFHQKRHLWPKKVESSIILTILKGDAFEKKV